MPTPTAWTTEAAKILRREQKMPLTPDQILADSKKPDNRAPATAAGRRRRVFEAELAELIRPWTDFRAEQVRLSLDAIEAEAADSRAVEHMTDEYDRGERLAPLTPAALADKRAVVNILREADFYPTPGTNPEAANDGVVEDDWDRYQSRLASVGFTIARLPAATSASAEAEGSPAERAALALSVARANGASPETIARLERAARSGRRPGADR